MPDKESRKEISNEWFIRAEHDLEGVRLLLQQEGPVDTTSVLVEEAMEKYIKGYLLLQGWKLRRIHDVEALVSEAITYDKTFGQFLELARIVSAFYLEARYPPGPPREYSREELLKVFAETEKFVARIKEVSGQPPGF